MSAFFIQSDRYSSTVSIVSIRIRLEVILVMAHHNCNAIMRHTVDVVVIVVVGEEQRRGPTNDLQEFLFRLIEHLSQN